MALGDNRDPIYAPDGKTWYETALAEAEKRGNAEAALENEAIITRDLKEELERVTRERNEWQEKFMALARASLVLGGDGFPHASAGTK